MDLPLENISKSFMDAWLYCRTMSTVAFTGTSDILFGIWSSRRFHTLVQNGGLRGGEGLIESRYAKIRARDHLCPGECFELHS